MYALSKRSRKRLEGIKPVLIEIVEEAIKESPYDFGIPSFGGKRTAEEQFYLYNKGVSKCDGYNKLSNHQPKEGKEFGEAFDIYAYVDGKATWNHEYYKPIADHIIKVAKECFNVDLEWGGNWTSFVDLPHFQL
jgi:peptidoglycan L-alanyl-D-glutamate endopeptidase CwlK